MKPKIIHLIASLDNGGCENYLLRTLPLMKDFDHQIITFRQEGSLFSKFKQAKIGVVNIKWHQVLKIIKQQKPSVVITYLFYADMLGRFVIQPLTKYPVIPFLRTTYNDKRYRIAIIFEKITKYFVKYYFANSKAVKEFYTNYIGVKENKITVIPNGIDINYFSKFKKSRVFKTSIGINGDPIIIVCVANLLPNKGHRYLLEAFDMIYRDNKNIRLLLVGDGIERKNLLHQVDHSHSKDGILFLGKRNDVPTILANSDIFVLPTLFEGMSNAILEAMASKLAILTTNISENRELITHNQNGILVKTKSSREIKLWLEKVIDDQKLRLFLGEKAQDQIQKKFGIDVTTRLFSKSINKLINS